MVRMAGFEPALSWSRTKHFTKLSYILIARIFYHILNEKKDTFPCRSFQMVRPMRLERTRPKSLPPQSSVSADSTTAS